MSFFQHLFTILIFAALALLGHMFSKKDSAINIIFEFTAFGLLIFGVVFYALYFFCVIFEAIGAL